MYMTAVILFSFQNGTTDLHYPPYFEYIQCRTFSRSSASLVLSIPKSGYGTSWEQYIKCMWGIKQCRTFKWSSFPLPKFRSPFNQVPTSHPKSDFITLLMKSRYTVRDITCLNFPIQFLPSNPYFLHQFQDCFQANHHSLVSKQKILSHQCYLKLSYQPEGGQDEEKLSRSFPSKRQKLMRIQLLSIGLPQILQ